jgi:hypothetical protein
LSIFRSDCFKLAPFKIPPEGFHCHDVYHFAWNKFNARPGHGVLQNVIDVTVGKTRAQSFSRKYSLFVVLGTVKKTDFISFVFAFLKR